MKRRILGFLVAASLLTPGAIAATPTPAIAFTGHQCTKATCRYFTSSYSTARYYYDRRTCDQWKDLSNTYLHGFNTKNQLLNRFPHRKLHGPC